MVDTLINTRGLSTTGASNCASWQLITSTMCQLTIFGGYDVNDYFMNDVWIYDIWFVLPSLLFQTVVALD